jgi:hypothetical protein
MLIGCN